MNETKLPKSLVFWGGTGQAKVMRPIAEQLGASVLAIFDDTPNLDPPFPDIELFLGWGGFEKWRSGRDITTIGFVVAIGNPHGGARLRLHDRLASEGMLPVSLVHPSAHVERNSQIADGAQIHAGAIVGVEARIGRQCIINTGAQVDHECQLAAGVEIGPGATLCGSVRLGVNAWVCAGATVIPRINIGNNAIVGAGAVVVRDVPAGVVVAGVPARPIGNSSPKE